MAHIDDLVEPGLEKIVLSGLGRTLQGQGPSSLRARREGLRGDAARSTSGAGRLKTRGSAKWTVERGQGKAAFLPSKQYLREPIAPS